MSAKAKAAVKQTRMLAKATMNAKERAAAGCINTNIPNIVDRFITGAPTVFIIKSVEKIL